MNDTALKTCSACRSAIDAAATRCPACTQRQPDATGLYRGVPGKTLGGVCASLAQRYDVDVTLVRVLFIASFAFSGPVGLWVYAALWAMTPLTANGRSPLLRFMDGVARMLSPPPATVARVDAGSGPDAPL
ncbi:MAG: PspC domain-containing protein [Myxococcaceae bacterium]|nr:PspC domain-containing protein [Myxococcaceae bacterium]